MRDTEHRAFRRRRRFRNPSELPARLIEAIAMAILVLLVGCRFGHDAGGGPVAVGMATARSMVLSIVGVHLISMLGTQLFRGTILRAPIGG
jgi:phospholipid/cholesterol/gamma-HCH transport system permease protein